MDGWMDGWVDGWVGGWMDGWMHGWMDGWNSVDNITCNPHHSQALFPRQIRLYVELGFCAESTSWFQCCFHVMIFTFIEYHVSRRYFTIISTNHVGLLRRLAVACLIADHYHLCVFESRREYIRRLFHLWLRLITFGGRSAHLAFHAQK